MKTSTKTTAIFFAALLLSLNIFATGFEFDQESYIDDIPFNVEEVVNQVSLEKALAVEFYLSEEEYIDDIPSNIENHTSLVKYSDTISQEFSFEEEEYIDDIPTAIVMKSCYRLIAVTN